MTISVIQIADADRVEFVVILILRDSDFEEVEFLDLAFLFSVDCAGEKGTIEL